MKKYSFLLLAITLLLFCSLGFSKSAFPHKLKTTKGSTNNTPLSELETEDQVHIKLRPDGANAYSGKLLFAVDDSGFVNFAKSFSLNLKINFKSAKDDKWKYEIYNEKSGKWKKIGESPNGSAWSSKTLKIKKPQNYISDSRIISVRLKGTNLDGPGLLDYAKLTWKPVKAETTSVSEVKQYGITWTFSSARPVGQFANGDYFVIAPVTIESVSPAPTGTRHGSMLNPIGEQAYDSRGGMYNADKELSFPITFNKDDGTQSIVSSISHPEEPECTNGSSDAWLTFDGGCQRGSVRTQAVLTILDSKPLAESFRPPYSGDTKPSLRSVLKDVCWDILPKLAPVASTPDASDLLRAFKRPWIDHMTSWTLQHSCATHNMYCYGRELGNFVSNGAAFILLDTPKQIDMATRMIQLGIDNYGVIQAGRVWGVDGGHYNGRKFPILFAGRLLNDKAMRKPGTNIGNEDGMTYYGANGVPLWGADCVACYNDQCAYAGACTGGRKDCRDSSFLEDGCSDYRNCCTSATWVGEALATRLLGSIKHWDNKAFFDYVDRWMEGGVDGGGGTSSFVSEMYDTYRNAEVEIGSC